MPQQNSQRGAQNKLENRNQKPKKEYYNTEEEHSEGPWIDAWIILEINDLGDDICRGVEMDFAFLALYVGINGQLSEARDLFLAAIFGINGRRASLLLHIVAVSVVLRGDGRLVRLHF
jgi:hypothetical protein